MANAKDTVLDLVKGLPEDATLEDIQYHLFVLQRVGRGLKQVEEGRVLSEAEMEERFSKWLAP
jgi:predicted transcriptional regulator